MHYQFCDRENTMACSLRVASCGHSIVYVDKDFYTAEDKTRFIRVSTGTVPRR